MVDLEKNTNEIANNAIYSFNTIIDFGWGSHIDQSRGGLVIYMKDGKTVVANQNKNYDGFVIDRNCKPDLTDDQKTEINDLMSWIEE